MDPEMTVFDTGACVGCTSVLCAAEGGITTWPGTVGLGDAAISASVGLPVDTIDTGACVGCTSVLCAAEGGITT